MNLYNYGDFIEAWDMNDSAKRDMTEWLVKKLLYPDRAMVKEQVDELVDSNNHILGDTFPGFNYQQDYFERGGMVRTNFCWEPLLDPRLHPKVVGLADRWYRLENDVDHISHVFNYLTEECRDWQEFRDALPDCVIQLESRLRSMARTRPEFYSLGDRELLRSTQELLLPRLHTYAAMHLLT